MSEKLKVALITGDKGYDVPPFQDMLLNIPSASWYIQHIDDFARNYGGYNSSYDVFLFYHWTQATPTDEKTIAAFEQLGETEQGILVLHHGLVAFRKWQFWSDLIGLYDRDGDFAYSHDECVRIDVADSEHPITKGLTGWEMMDETYKMANAAPDNTILLTTNHPKSLKTIGWVRQFKQARVFCLQAGHDHQTYTDPNFQILLERGVHWLAHRI